MRTLFSDSKIGTVTADILAIVLVLSLGWGKLIFELMTLSRILVMDRRGMGKETENLN